MGQNTNIELVSQLTPNLPETPVNKPHLPANGSTIILVTEAEPEEIHEEFKPEKPYVRQILWFMVFKIILLHFVGIFSLAVVPFAHNGTIVFGFFTTWLTMLGVQCGSHRLWAHRSYSANKGVRYFLACCHALAMQESIYKWVRDHRVHHKFSDTDGDPHNATRGLFFSHCGWLMVKKHPEVLRRGATLDLSDLLDDPVVRFNKKYLYLLVLLFWGILPTFIPVLLWDEKALISFCICVGFRYFICVHITWSVNSFAHHNGYRPYNTKILPVEASARHLLVGEGFHNYHHAFPWDYSASELGPKDVFNPATLVIKIFHKLGWAWDLKKPHPSLVERTLRTSGNAAVRYKRSFLGGLFEWMAGLTVMLSFIWIMLVCKYAYIYLVGPDPPVLFGTQIQFDVASLWSMYVAVWQYSIESIKTYWK